jgi:hypothetical protein
VWCTCSFACCLVAASRNRNRGKVFGGEVLFYSGLSSSRGYPEDSVRLEVRVPTVGKPSKSEDSDEEVQNLSSEDFHRNCETVTLSIVLQQYSTTTQYRAAQSDKVRDGPNYSSCSTHRTGTGVSAAASSPKCLGNSVRSTGSTETVLGNELSRQQCISTGPTEAVLSAATTVVLDSTRLHHPVLLQVLSSVRRSF